MENLEPKTRFEYFLNKIAENGGNSGSGGDQSTFDMSKIVLDTSTLEPVTIDGVEVPEITVGLDENLYPVTNPFIYDFINNDIPPIAKLDLSEELGPGSTITTTLFLCIAGAKANVSGLNQYSEGSTPVLLEDSLVYMISLFNPMSADPYNIALFLPSAQFGLKAVSQE